MMDFIKRWKRLIERVLTNRASMSQEEVFGRKFGQGKQTKSKQYVFNGLPGLPTESLDYFSPHN